MSRPTVSRMPSTEPREPETTTSVELVDRYVYAVVRRVPADRRADVAAELRTKITSGIDERVAAGDELVDAETAALLDMGDPEVVAAQHSDRSLHLIGPRYFLLWRRTLLLLLSFVVPLVTVAAGLRAFLEGADAYDVFSAVTSAASGTLVHVLFWVTAIFAVADRSGVKPEESLSWCLDDLPDHIPGTRDLHDPSTRLPELVTWLAALGFAGGALLWDHFQGWSTSGGVIHVLDASVWPWWGGALLALLAVEAVLAVRTTYCGWTMRLAVVNASVNLSIAAGAVWLLTQGRLLDPHLTSAVLPARVDFPVSGFTFALGVLVVGSALWEAFQGFRRSRA